MSFCHAATCISHIYTYIPSLLGVPPTSSRRSHSSRSSQGPELSAQCDTEACHRLPVLHMAVYIRQGYSLHSSQPLLPLPCPQVCSLPLCLYPCPLTKKYFGDFPVGPVAETPSFQCRGPGLDPWSGSRILHVVVELYKLQ